MRHIEKSVTPGILDWLDKPSSTAGIYTADKEEKGVWRFVEYAELSEECQAFAEELIRRGLIPGQVVGVAARGVSFIKAFFGARLAGAIPCPFSLPLFSQSGASYTQDLAEMISASGTSLVYCEPQLVEIIRSASLRLTHLGTPTILTTEGTVISESSMEAPQAQESVELIQFTGGSTSSPRAVLISEQNLRTNIQGIRNLISMEPADVTVSWLPFYHDMGLVGCLLTSIVNQSTLYLMEPEQFVRSPILWLECLGKLGANLTAAPNFGFNYLHRRIDRGALRGMDFSGWRVAIVGAERVGASDLKRTGELLESHGFRLETFVPAYGLAEATLAVTAAARLPATTLEIGTGGLRFGSAVPILRKSVLGDDALSQEHSLIVSSGEPLLGTNVSIRDEKGDHLDEGCLGEIWVSGTGVALGYRGYLSEESTRFDSDDLATGDAGFLLDGELFVIGRIGDSVRVRGQSVFADNIEMKIASDSDLRQERFAVLTGATQDEQFAVTIVEQPAGDWIDEVSSILTHELDPEIHIQIVSAPRGTIQRTTSGKPRRRLMWQDFLDKKTAGEVVWEGGPNELRGNDS